MKPRTLAGWIGAVMVAGALSCRTAAPVPAGRVDQLVVHVTPTADGSLLVREDYTIRPDAQGVIRLTRAVTTTETDGLELTAVAVDGVATAPTTTGFALSGWGPHSGVVTWAPPASGAAPRQLTLTFRAQSAIAVTAPRATMSWPVLAAQRGFDVGAVRVTFALPAGSAVYAGTGMAEAGWVVDWTRDGVTAARSPVPNAESGTLVAAFDFDRRGVRDPVWERNRDRARQFWPAFIAGALFFLVVGIGTLIILRMQYPRRPRVDDPSGPSAQEREVVVRGLRTTGQLGGLAAIGFGLAAYGVLGFLGPWVQLIPASMLLVSLLFLAMSGRFR